MKIKKFILSLLIMSMPILVSGCSSNIVAKFNDYNETYSGKVYYDSVIKKATIDIKSDTRDVICIGNAKIYAYPMWQFKLTCSDGRAAKGLLEYYKTEGKAFTNRNELITFSVAKKQSTINKAKSSYLSQIKDKPKADVKNTNISIYMQEME